MMRVGMNDDDTVDEVVATGAYVHFEDLGDAYILIIEEKSRHIHLSIPTRKKTRAFIFEDFDTGVTP